jgi:hypothetical protein
MKVLFISNIRLIAKIESEITDLMAATTVPLVVYPDIYCLSRFISNRKKNRDIKIILSFRKVQQKILF